MRPHVTEESPLAESVSVAFQVPLAVTRRILSTSLPSEWSRRLRSAHEEERREQYRVFLTRTVRSS